MATSVIRKQAGVTHPGKALAFLFVSPRDCAAVDELMAL
jgi:hypothetical protein